MTDLKTIPKDLAKTDPLLFSLLIILESFDEGLYFHGGHPEDDTPSMPTPSFSYAVNTWQKTYEPNSKTAEPLEIIKHDILMAIWKKNPEESCDIEFEKFPGGATRDSKRTDKLGFKLPFEDWRIRTFGTLDEIISCLIMKAGKTERDAQNQKVVYIANMFGWYIQENSPIQYAYVKDASNNDLFGIGAAFQLCCPKYDCCPAVNKNKLQKAYLENLGFDLDNLFA